MGDSGGDVSVRGREEQRQRRRSAAKFYSEREKREVRGRRRRRCCGIGRCDVGIRGITPSSNIIINLVLSFVGIVGFGSGLILSVCGSERTIGVELY